MYKFFLIILVSVTVQTVIAKSDDLPPHTKYEEVNSLSNSELKRELIAISGAEDHWKFSLSETLLSFFSRDKGLFDSYEIRINENLSSYGNKRGSELELLIQESRQVVDGILQRNYSDKKILELYRSIFQNPDSPFNLGVLIIQSERRMLIEKNISDEINKRFGKSALGQKILGLTNSDKRQALIKTVMFVRDLQNGLLENKKMTESLINALSDFSSHISKKSEFSKTHRVPLFIEFESSTVSSNPTQTKTTLAPLMSEVFNRIMRFAERNIQTPDGGRLLVIHPNDVYKVEHFLIEVLAEVKTRVKHYSDVAFANDTIVIKTDSTKKDPYSQYNPGGNTNVQRTMTIRKSYEQIAPGIEGLKRLWEHADYIEKDFSEISHRHPFSNSRSCVRLFSI